MTRDAWLLFGTRFVRLFAYGSLSVVLVFYLISIGLDERETGVLLTLTLAGDTVVSLLLTTQADRIGRRRVLIAGSALMVAAAVVFASTRAVWLLFIAGTVGVLSPSGNEVGPFLPIEQAALSQIVADRDRTRVLALYTLVGSFATAIGALATGLAMRGLEAIGTSPPQRYRAIVVLYGAIGVVLAAAFLRLSRRSEAQPGAQTRPLTMIGRLSGLEQSRGVVLKLSALFSLDAFAGGFVIQSFAAYWFYLRFGIDPAALGTIFFWANVFAGLSALLASRLAARFGLIETMVATHIPSNVLLMLVPVMPTLRLAVLVLLARFSISQMDVPTRQSYLTAVVPPEERSAAAGIAGVARTVGAAVSPVFVGYLFARPSLVNLPFFIAGALKITYDLLRYRSFRNRAAAT